ncbi:hypothetical protein [Bradyrhizobium sp.]
MTNKAALATFLFLNGGHDALSGRAYRHRANGVEAHAPESLFRFFDP